MSLIWPSTRRSDGIHGEVSQIEAPGHIVTPYKTMLYEYSKTGDYAKLESAAEHGSSTIRTISRPGIIVDSALKLSHHQKFVEYGEKIFAQKPTAQLALPIYQATSSWDKAKKTEWALKLLEYPEFNDNFDLRMEFVAKYAEKDLPKAAEYAEQALKSLEIAKKPDATSDADWNKASLQASMQRRHRHETNRAEKWAEAIPAFEKALQVECYDAGYYYIGLCHWNMGGIENFEAAYVSLPRRSC